MPSLEALGWSRFFADLVAEPFPERAIPARVVVEYQDRYRLISTCGHVWARLTGTLRRAAKSDRLCRPVVGDWVLVRPGQGDDMGTIVHLFERRTRFIRQAAGRNPGPQIVAANIDTVLVVTSCNQDFNPRRLERYLATVLESGAEPVIVLNKSDLCTDPQPYLDALAGLAPEISVAMVSALEERGLEALLAHLCPGRSAALVGSSGVGKSTLVNWLMGRHVQKVGDIRADDDRGRHVTTHRELFLLPEHGILIDTPGMRELKLWSADQGLDAAFADIADIARKCRFRDCRHRGEPGCAVEQAVRTGAVEQTRVNGYLKLLREPSPETPRTAATEPRDARRPRRGKLKRK